MVNPTCWTKKPQKDDFEKMAKHFIKMTISFGQLEQYVVYGCTIRPGILPTGKSKSVDFLGQQCFFVDVDNKKQTVQSSIDICREQGIQPNIIYPTFHYEADNQRHRLVFIAPTIIRDVNLRDRIQIKLVEIFHADQNAKDRPRQFCGGTILFWADERTRLDVDQFLGTGSEQGGESLVA